LEAPLWRCWLADRIHFGLLCSTRGAEVSPEARRLSLGHLQSSGGCELLSHCGETTPLAVSRTNLRHCIRCLREGLHKSSTFPQGLKPPVILRRLRTG
jgi:hypothetical protein